jgi:hypothetical protein
MSSLLSLTGTTGRRTLLATMVGGAPGGRNAITVRRRMELTWFRAPSGDDPGRLNLCFNALDLHVVRGGAEDVVVRHRRGSLDRARLLEQTAALGGALRGLGVRAGQPVAALLDDELDDLLLLLACTRVGAAYVALPATAPERDLDAHRPRLLATSRPLDLRGHVPAACLVRGFPPVEETRDVDWDVALRAGGADPAACADVPADLTALVVDGVAVPVGDALTHDSGPARRLATLAAGDPLDLTRG